MGRSYERFKKKKKGKKKIIYYSGNRFFKCTKGPFDIVDYEFKVRSIHVCVLVSSVKISCVGGDIKYVGS